MNSQILQKALPDDLCTLRPLPGVLPVTGPWLHVDDAYAGQMAARRGLLTTNRDQVLATIPGSEAASAELLSVVSNLLPGLGYARAGQGWLCPDGVVIPDGDDPMAMLGQVCQSDFCILEKPPGASEHLLTAAVLCFPASWLLSEKIGRPLMAIHAPVDEYDAALAKRVQRLFDGVQVGRPLWRFNRLWYEDAELFQPRSENARRDKGPKHENFLRSERQVILRLPETRAVVFAIHTYVVARKDAPDLH